MDEVCSVCGQKGTAADGMCLACANRSMEEVVRERIDQEAAASAPPEENKIDSIFVTKCLYENSLGDATLYAAMFRDKYLYCKGQQEWYAWDEHRWRFYAEVENQEGLYLGEDYVGTLAEALNESSMRADTYEQSINHGSISRIVMERRGAKEDGSNRMDNEDIGVN